ncbi:MAG: aminotransferase class V-fold PLP-dependent enzyme [Planctomycetia bacterium]|nr:aminotransferase class V-fold PLP-dependent enzyme [Planctomycetia bacterium]
MPNVQSSPAADDDQTWEALRREWSFAAGVTFLNHGSFGAPPRPVLEARRQLLDRLNADPMHFFFREMQPMMAAARARIGQFLNANADDLVFVENATVGMNAVARGVRLAPGDEVLATDHEYGAVLRIWQRTCDRAGARLVVAPLACPVQNAAEWVDALFAEASPRTRLVVVSHVTSPTAVVLPVAAICAQARARGIPVCIDGPHALVTVPLDLAALDCDYYTASCHKWLLAPVGAGFLYVHRRAQATIEPPIVSWGRTIGQEPSWRDEFNWSGTRDVTPCLSVPAGIDFLEAVGIESFRRRTHWLARQARDMITALTGRAPLVPDDPAWYGSMISLPLPPGEAAPLQDALWERFKIEVPIFEWQGRRLVRVSCQLYTGTADIERLRDALASLLDLAAK